MAVLRDEGVDDVWKLSNYKIIVMMVLRLCLFPLGRRLMAVSQSSSDRYETADGVGKFYESRVDALRNSLLTEVKGYSIGYKL